MNILIMNFVIFKYNSVYIKWFFPIKSVILTKLLFKYYGYMIQEEFFMIKKCENYKIVVFLYISHKLRF